jgi:hypothetical protein
MPEPWLVYEYSKDYGRTWEEITPSDRSPLVAEMKRKRELEEYDDGQGHIYRWRTR